MNLTILDEDLRRAQRKCDSASTSVAQSGRDIERLKAKLRIAEDELRDYILQLHNQPRDVGMLATLIDRKGKEAQALRKKLTVAERKHPKKRTRLKKAERQLNNATVKRQKRRHARAVR